MLHLVPYHIEQVLLSVSGVQLHSLPEQATLLLLPLH
jgi:hypothetical protein